MSNKDTANNKSNVAVQNNIVKEYKYEVEKLLYTYDFSESMRKRFTSENTATPSWIVEDMISILPDEVWTPNTKFLDICCKSGIFLEVIMTKLMKTVDYSEIGLKDNFAIKKYIAENQLYGVCWNYNSAELARCAVNGRASIDNGIVLYEHPYSFMKEKPEEFRKYIREKFGNMKFDVLVGNPPYNSTDIQLDFVTMSHLLSSTCTCMIIPAKWQAKGGEKNEQFRKNIVPHMKKIVYYPDSKEIFNINMAGGVSYFCIDIEEYSTTHIINKSVKSKAYNNEQHRRVFNCLNNILMDFLRNNTIKVWNPLTLDVDYFHAKIDSKDSGEITVVSADSSGEFYCLGYCSKNRLTNCNDACKYKVVMCRKQGGATISSDKNGMYLGTNKISILEPNIVPKNEYMILGAFNTLDEAESLKSYLSTRIVQFIINASLIGANLTNEESWRFVPDPGAFDHIFTDEELYKKYNFNQEEINIIESVIKERK